MMYLDLAELPKVFHGRFFWSVEKAAFASFKRKDHFGDAAISLDEQVRRLVAEHTGITPKGPIRLLTHLRYLGYCFNPVSFYYCYDEADTRVETIVAEVSNTPWGEWHCYVLSPAMNVGGGKVKQFKLNKQFHVSPFMGMGQTYDWRFADPSDHLSVHMQNFQASDGAELFDATMNLRKKELSGWNLAMILMRFPFMTGKVIFLIYFQAMIMWLRRFRFYSHPKHEQLSISNLHPTEKNSLTKEASKSAN